MISSTGIQQNILNVQTRALSGLTRPRRIAYIGGQGDANLGDEAMLEAARKLLEPRHLFDFFYPRQERRLASLGLSGLRYFEAVVLGGGTLINPHWLEKVSTAIDLGLPIYSLGTGVGSAGFGMSTAVPIDAWRPLLAKFAGLGVRGPISERRLRAIGLDNVEAIGDLALSLTPDEPASMFDEPSFAVNISRSSANRYKDSNVDDTYPALAELEIVVRRLTRMGWRGVPIAMHVDDVEPLASLMENATGTRPALRIVDSAERFFELVGGCRLMLAVRLHAGILSACMGVPPLMLGYRDKCLDFMQSMQLDEWHIALESAEPGEIVSRATDLVREAPYLRDAVHTRALQWRRQIEQYVGALPAARREEPARR